MSRRGSQADGDAPKSPKRAAAKTDGRTRFRYRTKALCGPWRATAAEAAGDAVRAGQAIVDDGENGSALRWLVKGRIESSRFKRAS
jgi:hypothetical protein